MVSCLRLGLYLTLEVGLQALKCYHDHRYIVQCLLVKGQLHDVLDRLATELMQGME